MRYITICFFTVFALSLNATNFLLQFIKNPTTIGAIAESSPALAKEITKYYPSESDRPLKILEVGAGSGVFTRHLLPKLRANDTLHVVELDGEFIPSLLDEFGKDPRIKIFNEDILKFPEGINDLSVGYDYDLIVSGLPLNSFDEKLVRAITKKFFELSKPMTIISFFEYEGVANLREKVLSFVQGNENDYSKTRKAIKEFIEKYQFEANEVKNNTPAAVVHHLRITHE